MKATLEKTALARLATVADITKSYGFGGSSFVRLTAAGDRLVAFANDGLMQSSYGVEAGCSDGDVCVSGGAFARAAASLPPGRVELVAEEFTLHIRCGGSWFSLPTADPDVVGLAPISAKFDARAEVPGSEFLALVRQLVPMAGKVNATGPAAGNPSLRGVYFRVSESGLECAGTDSYRLGVRSVEATVSGEQAISVPTAGLQLLAKHTGKDEIVGVELAQGAARFSVGDAVVHSRVLDGRYPDYLKVVPDLKGVTCTLTAPKEQLVETLARTALFVSGFTPARVEISETSVFRAGAKDTGESEQELDGGEFDGEPMTVWVNPHFLLDAVKGCDSERIKIVGFGERKPLRVETADPGPYYALVMLVRPPAGAQ